MDKRAILFLILSVVILYLYSYFEYQREQKRLERIKPAPVPQQSTPSSPAAITDTQVPSQSLVQAPQIQEQEVVVETDFYRAVLTNRGGMIKHWELKQYREKVAKDSPPIVLFDSQKNKPNLFPLQVWVEGESEQTRERFLNGLYRVEGQDIKLQGPGRQGQLSFLARDDSGRQIVVKRLTFYSDRYDVDVRIEAEGFPKGYTLYLGTNFAILDWGTTTMVSFVGPTSLIDQKIVQDKPSDIQTEVVHPGQLAWTALQDKYFLAALIPQDGAGMVVARKSADHEVTAGIRHPPAGQQVSVYRLYAGPKEYDRLRSYRLNLEETIDFGWFIYGSWFLVRMIAQPLFAVLRLLYDFTHNYGVAIILLTASIKLLFVPLTHKSYVSMRGMQELQPKVAALQKKYKDNRQKLQQELMELYRKHKVNPLGGCLPMVLQIPVFIALFNIFYTTIELRHAPFMLWIKDLSDKDPYYILPIIMGVSMVVQQKLQPTTMDPTQAKILLFLPVLFTYFFLWFPSGLVLYWLVNNILSILQMYITVRYLHPAKQPAVEKE
jgi:YidC/Oxa1 family membrane protein insertase